MIPDDPPLPHVHLHYMANTSFSPQVISEIVRTTHQVSADLSARRSQEGVGDGVSAGAVREEERGGGAEQETDGEGGTCCSSNETQPSDSQAAETGTTSREREHMRLLSTGSSSTAEDQQARETGSYCGARQVAEGGKQTSNHEAVQAKIGDAVVLDEAMKVQPVSAVEQGDGEKPQAMEGGEREKVASIEGAKIMQSSSCQSSSVGITHLKPSSSLDRETKPLCFPMKADLGQWERDADCTECSLQRPDPTPHQLMMYLHALRYKVQGSHAGVTEIALYDIPYEVIPSL